MPDIVDTLCDRRFEGSQLASALPFFYNNPAEFVELYRTMMHFAKKACPFQTTERYEVGTGLGVVVAFEPNRAAMMFVRIVFQGRNPMRSSTPLQLKKPSQAASPRSNQQLMPLALKIPFPLAHPYNFQNLVCSHSDRSAKSPTGRCPRLELMLRCHAI
jgi:hypothetical protein